MTDQLETIDSPAQLTEAQVADVLPDAPAPVSRVVLAGLGILFLSPVALAVFGGKSFVALVCFTLAVLAAVVCGVGWSGIANSAGRQRGARLAAVGMLGAVGWIATLFLISQAHGTISRGNCLTNQKEISLALTMYAQDYGHFPPDWAAAQAYTDKTLTKSIGAEKWICPARNWLDPRPARAGYGMNAALAGKPAGTFREPSTLILTADAVSTDGLLRGPADLARNRHGGTFVVTYADGSARYVFRNEPVRLRP